MSVVPSSSLRLKADGLIVAAKVKILLILSMLLTIMLMFQIVALELESKNFDP